MSRRSPETLDPAAQRELAAIDATLAGRPVELELGDLERLVHEVRAERPRPADVFARELDRRAAAGFARADGRRRTLVPAGARAALRRLGRRGRLLPAMGAAASLLLALVVAGSLLRAGEVPTGLSSKPTPRQATPEVAAPARGTGDAAEPAIAPVPPDGTLPGRRERRVERQAAITLSGPADRIAEVGDDVIRVTDRLGGVVVSSTVRSGEDGQAGASFDLRIPVARLDNALAELSKLAHVRQRTQSSQDITGAYVSAQERLRESRAEREALLRQLARADTEAAIESVRARLRIVNGEIAARRTEVARLSERTSFATVVVSIEPGKGGGAAGDPWTPRDALRDAARVLEVIAAILVIVLAIAGPLALLGGGAAYVARALRRRRREQALERA
jgi:hypothetical protein